MKAAPQPLFYCLAEVFVKVLKMAYAQLTKMSIPVRMRAHYTINICRRVLQVDP